MRVVFIHPSYHSGGAEVAGNWPPAWVAYLGGALNSAEVRSVAGDDQSLTSQSSPTRSLRPSVPGIVPCSNASSPP